ncbi:MULTISPECIES: DNA primase [Romboutsia]|nr:MULTISPECIES: DNA primase [Romboutsia]MCH1960715.1 DNA primase [Romboutsia hominis]MCH1968853.1 DNA primase [Romboutsia hominis]MDB8793628.1 DNA primase [Romboutsia sp. 1001216sp1]MDB8795025.1 DNA primase [Romboutsia sp. 1001216sp1]MDB8798835.1 DNA primase [Romboutsia sp. 1001216sp1]
MNDIKDIIEEVKSRCDIVSTISQYIELKSSGINYKGLCPFHGEKTPSFYVNESKQIYKCFGCGEGGDVINFVMKMENLDFIDAVKVLAQKYGIEINTNMDEESKKKLEKIKKFQDIHTEAARFYFSNLHTKKNSGYAYLRSRGLDDKIIKKFGLGYSLASWNSLMDYLTSKGYSNKDLIECGLLAHKKESNKIYDKFRNRVMFPIFDYRGNVIGFGGRVLDDSLPKYLNSPDTITFNKRYNLYGLNFSRKEIKNKTLILVEGYMDLISLYQYGIKNVVATLGTALTKEQGMLIKRYADNVIISYDSDEAGIKATLRAIEILSDIDINVKVLNLKDCKDPDEFIRKYGVKGYQEAIDESINQIIFRINNLKKQFNLNKDEDKVKFAKEASKIIKKVKSPVEIDYYTKYLSDLIQISIDSIKREIYGKSYNKNGNNKYQKSKYIKKDEVVIEKPKIITNGEKFVEKNLIKLMIEDKKLRDIIVLKVNDNDFLLDESKEILNWIIKNQELDKITIDKIKSLNISEEYIKDIENISLNNMSLNNVKGVDDIIKNVKKNTLNEKMNRLLKEQKEIEKNKNNSDTKEVDGKIMEIALKIVEIRRMLQKL